MILNKQNLKNISPTDRLIVPEEQVFNLPEKVLQFGTGVLLRGLPDYFIDKANRQGIFNGRIVVVKSTGKGSSSEFDRQDSLYTICVRGIENGKVIEQNIISSSISQVLTAHTQWQAVLDVAASDDLEVIISNTTEVGIQLADDDIRANPPVSFPGKLLTMLYHRYKVFNGDKDKGLIIIPTELISDNGTKLMDIVKTLAAQNGLDNDFITWLTENNTFCNSLVDRIVPGKPDESTLTALYNELGYQDDLLTIAEVYTLWAIEGDERIKQKLPFYKADTGVIITPDITMYKELKLRLLNGTHTMTCAIAFLAGFSTVREAVENEAIASFSSNLMLEEIAKAIPYPVAPEEATRFAYNVLDRFRNPQIRHQWISISSNYTLKIRMRIIPVLLKYVEQFHTIPENISLGFAGYFLFMKSVKKDGKYFGYSQGNDYPIDDDYAAYYAELWNDHPAEVAEKALADTGLWGSDLSLLPGFVASVNRHLQIIAKNGIMEAARKSQEKNISA